MSTINEIKCALELCKLRPDGMDFSALELMIASALAEARREGAEAMRAKAAQGWDGCMYNAPGETLDIGADIRALPLPTGPRQAVLLTDEAVVLCAAAVGERMLGGGA